MIPPPAAARCRYHGGTTGHGSAGRQVLDRQADPAEGAVGDLRAELLHARQEPLDEAHHQLHPGALAGVYDLLRLGERVGQRFLHQHMRAVLRRQARGRQVQVVGQADAHRVQAGGRQRLQRRVDLATEARRQIRGPPAVRVSDADNVYAGRAIGLGMRNAHHPCAHDAHPKRHLHSSVRRRSAQPLMPENDRLSTTCRCART